MKQEVHLENAAQAPSLVTFCGPGLGLQEDKEVLRPCEASQTLYKRRQSQSQGGETTFDGQTMEQLG